MTVFDVNFDEMDNYTAPIFEETEAIIAMQKVPRFGNTNNITLLFLGTEEDKKKYVYGLLGVGILILALFLVWSLTLLILKCCGRRVGCASGMPKPIEYDNVYPDKYESDVRRAKRSIMCTRIFFLLSGLAALASVVAFVIYGVGSLQNAVVEAQNSVNMVQGLTDGAYNDTTKFLESYNITVTQEENLVQQESKWCPYLTDPPENIVNNPQLSQVLSIISEYIDVVQDNIAQLSQGLYNNVGKLQEDLADTSKQVETLNQQMEKVNIVFVVGLAMAIFQGCLILVMMFGVILAWCEALPKPFRCMQSYLLLPIFLLSMLVSIVFSVIFVVGAAAGSDLCFPTPDAAVNSLLSSKKHDIGPFAYETAEYYINGCRGQEPLNFTAYVPEVKSTIDSVHDFIMYLDNNTEIINEACGANTTIVTSSAYLIDSALHIFGDVVDDVRRLLFCSNINGLYTQVTYNTVCTSGVNALYGIYASQLCIAIFSMIMVTLRVSWQQVEN